MMFWSQLGVDEAIRPIFQTIFFQLFIKILLNLNDSSIGLGHY